jgi:sugar phosphate permease
MQTGQRSYGRWYILGIICLMYLITYLDRVIMANTAPEIQKEFGFDQFTKGVILGALFWGYSLFQLPGGLLSDRFGPRTVLATLVALWSVVTVAAGFAGSASSLVILLFLLGAGEAGAFPGATRAMQMWYPRRERGFAQGFTHSASRFGAFIAPPIIVLIISTPALGWRWVFYLCGAVGVLWSAWWYVSFRNLPEEHRLVSPAELEHIRGLDVQGRLNPAALAKDRPGVLGFGSVGLGLVGSILGLGLGLGFGFGLGLGWSLGVGWGLGFGILGLLGGRLLRSPNMWAIMCAYAAYVYCLTIFLTWVVSYLVDARHFTPNEARYWNMLPLAGMVIGNIVGGVATDWLLHKTGNARLARRAVAITGLLACTLFIALTALVEDGYLAVYCLTGAGFFLECTIGASWSVPMDTAGKHSGTVSAMMNMAGQLVGAILSPVVFGLFAQQQNYRGPWIVAAILLVLGAAIWGFWLDPERSVIEKEEETPAVVPVAAE